MHRLHSTFLVDVSLLGSDVQLAGFRKSLRNRHRWFPFVTLSQVNGHACDDGLLRSECECDKWTANTLNCSVA
jgi:hypothetical protein